MTDQKEPFDISLLMRLTRAYERNKPLFSQFHANVTEDAFEVKWNIHALENNGSAFNAELSGIALRIVFVTAVPAGSPAIEFWQVDHANDDKLKLLGQVGFLPSHGLTAIKYKNRYGGQDELSIVERDEASLLLAQYFWMAWPEEKNAFI